MITDMTEGSPSKILWKFSMPMLLSVIFQQLYNVVDSIVAGQFIGVDALAAVGASYPVTMIFMAVATGCNIGCSVVISQLFGAKSYGHMKTAVSTSLISVLALSVFLTGAGFLLCRPILSLLNTPGNIFGDSALYLNVYIGGFVFLFLYNICTGVFTALGDSKTPLYFLIFSSVGNIVLDLVFVICFHMGVGGVAWATFIAQGVSSMLAALALLRRLATVTTQHRYALFSWRMLGRICRIAVPSILQQSFISVGNLFIQGLVNGYGSVVVAGYSAAVKLNTFAITSFTTMANGLSSFTAQNIGAGKPERIRKGYRAGLLMAVCVVIPFVLAFFVFSRQMIGIFLDTANDTENVVQVGVDFLRMVSPFYLLIGVKLMADGVLRGAGSMGAFMTSTFTDLVLRVALAYLLSIPFQALGIWLSWPIGWAVSTVLSVLFYATGIWKKNLYHTLPSQRAQT